VAEALVNIAVPQLDANADVYRVVELCLPDRSQIATGAAVAVIETSKSVFVIESPADGRIVFAPAVKAGQEVRAHETIAIVAHSEADDSSVLAAFPDHPSGELAVTQLDATFSDAAIRRMREHGVAPEVFRGKGLVTLADIETYLQARKR
jgi:pyruvate/2-oxoglutarate dehydrogenase complex dihydrolipoamide acyltransferase (E2) component